MKRSQCFQILKYLQKGNKLTGLKALRLFDTMKLATRIGEINMKLTADSDEDYIHSGWIKLPNGKRVKEYWL